MERFKLNAETLEKIKDRPFLLAKIAVEMGVRTAYLLRLIRENDKKLTCRGVVQIILDELKVTEEEIYLEEKLESSAA